MYFLLFCEITDEDNCESVESRRVSMCKKPKQTVSAKRAVFAVLVAVEQRAPQQIDDDQRRRHRRFALVFSGESVSVEAPCFDALLLDLRVRIAATITNVQNGEADE